MDHIKFASDIGFLCARAKFAAENPEAEKKKGFWGNLYPGLKALLLGAGGVGLGYGYHKLTNGDYGKPFRYIGDQAKRLFGNKPAPGTESSVVSSRLKQPVTMPYDNSPRLPLPSAPIMPKTTDPYVPLPPDMPKSGVV